MEIFNILLPIICLIFGFYAGYKVGHEKELPKIPKEIAHPIETIKEKKEEHIEDEKLKEIEEALEELDKYDAGL